MSLETHLVRTPKNKEKQSIQLDAYIYIYLKYKNTHTEWKQYYMTGSNYNITHQKKTLQLSTITESLSQIVESNHIPRHPTYFKLLMFTVYVFFSSICSRMGKSHLQSLVMKKKHPADVSPGIRRQIDPPSQVPSLEEPRRLHGWIPLVMIENSHGIQV